MAENMSVTSGNRYIEYAIIMLMCLSFILSDWLLLSVFTFSDFLMGVSLILLAMTRNIHLKKSDYFTFLFIEGFLLLHISLSLFFNESFVLRTALTNVVKIGFYHTYVMTVWRYIKTYKLEKLSFKWLNLSAFSVILIGVYITFALVSDYGLPYEFLWTFTRTDRWSYLYRGTNDLVRTRSLFSEPAHLGYFLNTILAVNLFNPYNFKNTFFNLAVITGILVTFSYSSIGILAVLLTVKLIVMIRHNGWNVFDLKMLVPAAFIILAVSYFRDTLYETLINRTQEIFQGEENSAFNRLIYSWSYINDNWLLGNGLGHTPPIQNIYAYMLSDLGIVAFAASIVFSVMLLVVNTGIGIGFIMLNFQKGGYLSPAFPLVLLIFMIFTTLDKWSFQKKERG